MTFGVAVIGRDEYVATCEADSLKELAEALIRYGIHWKDSDGQQHWMPPHMIAGVDQK